jgi:hypothetical protein
MPYGVAYDVAAPVELYDAMHAEFAKYPSDGMILHVARPAPEGFQVLEVWESKETYVEWAGRYIGLVIEAVAAAGWKPPQPVVTEFEVRGLVVPDPR